MRDRAQYILAGFFILQLFTAGFIVYLRSDGKSIALDKSASAVAVRSTGGSALYYEEGKAAEFVGHHLIGLKYPNGLYQGFLAIHFDEMDSVLTRHSGAGRTNAKNNPGDKNNFQRISGTVSEDASTITDITTFTVSPLSARFLAHQIIEARKDSSHFIHVSYIFEFIKPAGDPVSFTRTKILFGYDGDIGNSLGGFSDDSSGYFEDDSTAIVYVFDDSLRTYTGVGLIHKQANAVAGNYAFLHQTINRDGANDQNLDTLLFQLMNQPLFSSLPKSDVSVYWSIDLGTIVPADTVRDTVRFVWVNGTSRNALLQAAKGFKTDEKTEITFTSDKIPLHTALWANYPNPFNPETTIKYDVDKEGFVSLKIYNLLGQEVRTLFEGRKGAGRHTIQWNGRDAGNRPVSSGIYIYRLQTDRFSSSRKMILLK